MDATFKAYAISQVKLFMFSGHDTTSSSIYYILHILSTYTSALQRIWEEHKSFFDFDLAEKAKTLEANPRFAQPASYTLEVIKETMRLFPVVSSTASVPGFSIVDSLGHSFHTENFLIWVSSQAVYRDGGSTRHILTRELVDKNGEFLAFWIEKRCCTTLGISPSMDLCTYS